MTVGVRNTIAEQGVEPVPYCKDCGASYGWNVEPPAEPPPHNPEECAMFQQLSPESKEAMRIQYGVQFRKSEEL